MGRMRQKPLKASEQFVAVDDFKLRLTIQAMADRYSEQIRDLIYHVYQDDEINALYRAIRASGIYQHGSKTKTHRKIIEYPNAYVADFVNTAMTQLYGPDWVKKRQALRHELVSPWLVIQLKP